MDITEIAIRTREILDTNGWNKGSLSSLETGPDGVRLTHCIGGALNLALTDGRNIGWQYFSDTASAVYSELAHIIREQFPERGDDDLDDDLPDKFQNPSIITRWNNHLDTTREDIDMVLEKLAVRDRMAA